MPCLFASNLLVDGLLVVHNDERMPPVLPCVLVDGEC